METPLHPHGPYPQPPSRGNDLWDERYPLLGRINKEHVDFFVWVVWVAVTTLPNVPMGTLLKYACAAYFVAGFVLHPQQVLPVAARAWPVFLLPILYFVSAMWAPSSNDAIKLGFLFTLTGIVPIFLAARLTARHLILGFLVVESVGAILSLKDLNIQYMGFAIGAFGQKNWLALHMFLLYIASMILLLDRKMHVGVRLYSALMMPVAIYLILRAQSTTTLAMAAVATLAIFGHAFVWQPVQRLPHIRTLMVLGAITLVIVAAFFVFGVLNIDVEQLFFKITGKDATLTGRTYLWDFAKRYMEEHPWGAGGGGFWRPEIGEADSLVRRVNGAPAARFSFHNSWLENGVQLGYLGMYVTMFVAAWAGFCVLRTWLMRQTMENAFFLVLSGVILMRASTEPDFATELSPTAMLCFIAAIRRDKKPDPVPAPAPRFASLAYGPPLRR